MLYKYKTIGSFRFLLDIIVNQRLYAAKYNKLNDPMEGLFWYNPELFPQQFVDEIKSDERHLKVPVVLPHE